MRLSGERDIGQNQGEAKSVGRIVLASKQLPRKLSKELSMTLARMVAGAAAFLLLAGQLAVARPVLAGGRAIGRSSMVTQRHRA